MLKEAASTGLEISRPVRVEVSRAVGTSVIGVGAIAPGEVSAWLERAGVRRAICPDAIGADALWESEHEARFLCLLQDGRDWIVSRALRLRAKRVQSGAGRLLDKAMLVSGVNAWTDLIGAAQRLRELAELSGTPERVLLCRVEDLTNPASPRLRDLGAWLGLTGDVNTLAISAAAGVGVWRQWLTEDDKALLRQTASSVFEDLGYVGKGGW